MIINLLLGVLLLLGIAWIALGIAYLWRLFQDSTTQSGENNQNWKGNRQGERPKPSVSQKQIDKGVCQNSFSAKDSYHFVKNNRYQRVNNSMITVTLIFMRE